jgi:hypothetical protein
MSGAMLDCSGDEVSLRDCPGYGKAGMCDPSNENEVVSVVCENPWYPRDDIDSSSGVASPSTASHHDYSRMNNCQLGEPNIMRVHDVDDKDTGTWSIVGGNPGTPWPLFDINPDSGVISVSPKAEPQTRAELLDHEAYEAHDLEVMFTDAGGLSSTANLHIVVIDVNEDPHFVENPVPQTRYVQENSITNTFIGGALRATDPDDGDMDKLRFSMSAGTDYDGLFVVDSVSGFITLGESVNKVNFEALASYDIAITVVDGNGGEDEIKITVQVRDVNEAPEGTGGTELYIREDADTGDGLSNERGSTKPFDITGTATDVDGGKWGKLKYSIIRQTYDKWDNDKQENTETATTVVKLDAESGVLVLTEGAGVDFELYTTYDLTMRVTDGGGLYDDYGMKVNVIDVNEAPTWPEDEVNVNLNENEEIGKIVKSLAPNYIDAADEFKLDVRIVSMTNGGSAYFELEDTDTDEIRIKQKKKINYEYLKNTPGVKTEFEIVIEAKDRGIVGVAEGGATTEKLKATMKLKIIIKNVNDAPVFPAAKFKFKMPEDEDAGKNIGKITASDEDGDTLDYSIETGGQDNIAARCNKTTEGIKCQNTTSPDRQVSAGIWGINSNGQIYVDKWFVVDAGQTYKLKINAEDNEFKVSKTVEIEILEALNKAPVINDAHRSVKENAMGAPVGNPLSCSDVDINPPDGREPKDQRLTYSIVSGDDYNWFNINPFTAQLSTRPEAKINFENGITTVKLVVMCQDDGIGELADTALVTVSITDVNEDPRAKDSIGEAQIPENRPLNYMLNSNFADGKGIGGMLRCNSVWACTHLVGTGPDKYFEHGVMEDCPGCVIADQTADPPTGYADFSGYVLRMTGKDGGADEDSTTANNIPQEGNTYDAYTGVEMVVSYPATLKVTCWMKVSKTYTGGDGVFQVTAYKNAPPHEGWDAAGNILAFNNGKNQKAFPTATNMGKWVLVETTINLVKSLDHPKEKVDIDFDNCDDPREDETVRFIKVSFVTHVKNNAGTVEVTGLRVVDDTVVGNVGGFDDFDANTKLAYWIKNTEDTPFRLPKNALTDGYGAELSIADANPLTLGVLLDFESIRRLALVIEARDDGDANVENSEKLSARGIFNVYICNRNDPPVIMPAKRSVLENTAFGTSVGSPLPFLEQDSGQKVKFTVEAGNVPDKVIEKLEPLSLGADGTNFGRNGDWWDVTKYLVLGAFPSAVKNVCYDGKNYLGNDSKGEDNEAKKMAEVGDEWAPAVGATLGGKKWVEWTTDSTGYLNFERSSSAGATLGSQSDATVYGAVYLYSKEAQSIKIGFGSDDGMALWLNGEKIFTHDGCRAVGRAQNVKNNVDLLEGENIVVFKVHENKGGFAARVSLNTVKGVVAKTTRLSEEDLLRLQGTFHEERTFWFSDSVPSQLVVANAAYMDHEAQSTYNLVVRAMDNGIGQLSDTAEVTVTIEDVNEPPIVTGRIEVTVAENRCGGTKGASVTKFGSAQCENALDLGNLDIVDYEDSKDESLRVTYILESNLFQVSSNGEVQVAAGAWLDYEKARKHTLVVTVRDSMGLITETPFTVNVQNQNDPPVILSQTIFIREDASSGHKTGLSIDYAPKATDHAINGKPIQWYDAEHEKIANQGEFGVGAEGVQEVRFRIGKNSGTNHWAIDSATGQITVDSVSLDYERKAKSYDITVEATDCKASAGECANAWSRTERTDHAVVSADITISVIDVNERPEMSDLTLEVSEDLVEFGPAGKPIDASDPDTTSDQKLVFSIKSGNEDGLFAIEACSGQLSLAEGRSLDFETVRFYKMLVAVVDKGNLGTEAWVTVKILDENESPEMPVGGVSFDVDENSKAGTLIGQFDLSTVFDPDSPRDVTKTKSGDACLTWKDTGLMTDNEIFQFDLQKNYCRPAGDSTGSWCYINGKDSKPTKANCHHQDVHYKITTGNADNAFAIDLVTGDLTVGEGAALNFEGNSRRLIEVSGCDTLRSNSKPVKTKAFDWADRVQKSEGKYVHKAMCSSMPVLVNIKNINDPPRFVGRSLAGRSVPENSPTDTPIGQLALMASDDDGDQISFDLVNDFGLFRIDATTGRLYVRLSSGNTLDFEKKSQYTLNVQAFDRARKTDADVKISTAEIIINLEDMNERPTLSGNVGSVSEDATPGTKVGQPLTELLVDQDSGQTYMWKIEAGDPRGAFVIDEYGQISVSEVQGGLNFEDPTGRSFTLTVKVRDFATGSQGGRTSFTTSGTVNINVTDANDPPVFRLGSKVLRYIPEDAVANQKLLGDPVVAIDEDANDNDGVGLDVHYTKDIVASPGWTYFSIDSKTGVLSINGQTPGADFDYETLGDNGNNTYELVVIATDEAGATGKVTVTVELNDVNEPPVVQPGLVRYITEVSPRGALVGAPIPAEDKDLGGGQRLRFSMGLQKNAPTDADKNIMSRHFGITEHGQLFVKVGYESL